MMKTSGARHTLEFKQEATRLVKGCAKYCCGCENTVGGHSDIKGRRNLRRLGFFRCPLPTKQPSIAAFL